MARQECDYYEGASEYVTITYTNPNAISYTTGEAKSVELTPSTTPTVDLTKYRAISMTTFFSGSYGVCVMGTLLRSTPTKVQMVCKNVLGQALTVSAKAVYVDVLYKLK